MKVTSATSLRRHTQCAFQRTGVLRLLARRWRLLGYSLQLVAMLSWTVLTPANAGYAPDGNGQPIWTEPNGEPEPEGSAPDWSDHDGDNLVTWLEGFYGSDPYGYDTDGDGIHDGDEVFTTQTSPTAWDTDGDGIGDLEDYYGYYSGGGDGGDSSDTSSSSDSSDTSSSSDTSDSSSSSDTSDLIPRIRRTRREVGQHSIRGII